MRPVTDLGNIEITKQHEFVTIAPFNLKQLHVGQVVMNAYINSIPDLAQIEKHYGSQIAFMVCLGNNTLDEILKLEIKNKG